MPLITAVLVATTCTAGTCNTYKIADFYGDFENVGRNHCDSLAIGMNTVPNPKGFTMLYQCHSPDKARLVITADIDRKF